MQTDMVNILNRLSRSPERPHIRIEEDTVVKHGNPDAIAAEAVKTRNAAEIAGQSCLFRVPELLDHDVENGVLVFERIRHFVPIAHPIAYGRMGTDLVNRCATALATIHQRLEIADQFRDELPSPLNGNEDDRVNLHGDFNTANIVYIAQTDDLVVLDWSLSPLLGGRGTVGSACVDVAWFIQGLFVRPSTYILSRRPAPCADLFLQAYEDKVGRSLNRGRLREIGVHVHGVVAGMFGRSRVRHLLHSRQLAGLKRYFDRVN